ncbi:hypothetical protein J6590_032654 [Homalodisca vitripennis]|nr:hypothetical protein J6590_032654 [Homalodisca vitripennis]
MIYTTKAKQYNATFRNRSSVVIGRGCSCCPRLSQLPACDVTLTSLPAGDVSFRDEGRCRCRLKLNEFQFCHERPLKSPVPFFSLPPGLIQVGAARPTLNALL